MMFTGLSKAGNRALFGILLAGGLLLIAKTGDAQIQRNSGDPTKRMTKAVERVMGTVTKIAKVSEFGYDDGTCVLGSLLRPGATVTFNKNLKGGTEYYILGGGDDNVTDLDIYITDENGKQIIKDDDIDAAPKVHFRAPKDGKYTIKLDLFEAKAPGFCVAAILKKGGYNVPTKNLQTATDNFLKLAKTIEPRKTVGFNFHEKDSVWCLFGSILDEGKSSVVSIKAGGGDRAFIAAADPSSKGLGLYLADKDNKFIKKDEDHGALPILRHTTTDGVPNRFQVTNKASNGPALVLYGVFRID